MTPLSRLLNELVSHSGGTAANFARTVGLTPQQLSAFMSPRQYDRPPGVMTCLKIARAGRCDASRVLRAAGKDDYAQMIEQLYGRSVPPPKPQPVITATEFQHVKLWRIMTPGVRRAISILMIRASLARERPHRAPRGKTSSSSSSSDIRRVATSS